MLKNRHKHVKRRVEVLKNGEWVKVWSTSSRSSVQRAAHAKARNNAAIVKAYNDRQRRPPRYRQKAK